MSSVYRSWGFTCACGTYKTGFCTEPLEGPVAWVDLFICQNCGRYSNCASERHGLQFAQVVIDPRPHWLSPVGERRDGMSWQEERETFTQTVLAGTLG